ncbi:MAG: hypothetical protein IJ375_00365 [Oscillospiraceae bacterium]|nr:hypothetical protein [Oscillospiraceae bacterium]
MQQIPVYVFTGFLDSGKTKFIQETLEDPRFNDGERTLLLVFEEGEEEYDFSTYPKQCVYMEALDQTTVTTRQMADLAKKYKAQRVVAELNGMQQVGDLYMRFPEEWVVAQEVMFADATTFIAYNANMRNLVMDKLVGAQMVVFNRLEKGSDTMPFHKLARAANRKIDILYDYTDGSTAYDDVIDPLPFDINAPVIELKDEDFALWYRDVTEEPEKYDGKTVKFKAQVAMLRRDKDKMFAPGRFVMTCCVEDIQFCGVPCRYENAKSLESRSWVMVTAKIAAEKHKLYKGDIGPVLTAIEVIKGAEPADPDVATF